MRGTLLLLQNSPINAIEIPKFASGFLRLIIDLTEIPASKKTLQKNQKCERINKKDRKVFAMRDVETIVREANL